MVIICSVCNSKTSKYHKDHDKNLCKECHNKLHKEKHQGKGNKREEYEDYINSNEWQQKRQLAFKEYGHKCTKCGSEKELHVHHNTYKHFRNETLKELNVLCKVCHMALHEGIKLKAEKRKLEKLSDHKNKVTVIVPVKNSKACKTCMEYLNSFSPCRVGKLPSILTVCTDYCSKKEYVKPKNSKPTKNKKNKSKTMKEVILSLEQIQKNAEIRNKSKAKKESTAQIHIGIGTPNQRWYKKEDQPVTVIEKVKVVKPKKPKKSKISTEYVKVKTWLDVIQESL